MLRHSWYVRNIGTSLREYNYNLELELNKIKFCHSANKDQLWDPTVTSNSAFTFFRYSVIVF